MTAYVSAFDLFSVGIGPSSSHTVGPMRAALAFVLGLERDGLLGRVDRVTCSLFGSLGSTGIGHGTPDAVVAGLRGLTPEGCDPAEVRHAWSEHPDGGTLLLAGVRPVDFSRDDVSFVPRTRLPGHPNALTLSAWDRSSEVPVRSETYYSVGGGFIRRDGDDPASALPQHPVPMPFRTAESLIDICDDSGLPIDAIARRNEEAMRTPEAVDAGLDAIWAAMHECVTAGLADTGTLPGGLGVKRRARAVRERLDVAEAESGRELPTEWLHAFALAVNEQNASGGRVVTAPTNGRPASSRRSAATTCDSSPGRRSTASADTCSPRPRSGRCSRRTPPSPVRRAGVRRRSAPRARWRPAPCAPCSAAPHGRSRTRRRSRWSITSA